MQEMYQETLQDKRQYKKQILGSRDSFGKIFDITRKLDVIQPQKLFMETIRVMEDVLENHNNCTLFTGFMETFWKDGSVIT